MTLPQGASGRQGVSGRPPATQATHPVTGQPLQFDNLIGRMVKRWWPDYNAWFDGVITDYDALKQLHWCATLASLQALMPHVAEYHPHPCNAEGVVHPPCVCFQTSEASGLGIGHLLGC